MILPKGSKLICRNCGTAIFKTKKDFYKSDRIKISDIKELNGFVAKEGKYPECPKCLHKTDMYKPWNYKKPGED